MLDSAALSRLGKTVADLGRIHRATGSLAGTLDLLRHVGRRRTVRSQGPAPGVGADGDAVVHRGGEDRLESVLGLTTNPTTTTQLLPQQHRSAGCFTYPSVYGRDVPSFDDIRETFLAVHRGWPEVVDDVARAFPGTAMKLTRVERDPMEDRVRGLVGPELAKRFRLDGDERPNAAPTVEAMAAAAGSGGGMSPDDLVARYADGARFDPLTEDERSRLARRYSEDVAAPGRLPAATPGPR